MYTKRKPLLAWLVGSWIAIGACSGPDASPIPAPPAGACRTSPTAATGSSSLSCTMCVQANCNAELNEKAGSGWASQYLGGDGACAAFNACECDCSKMSLEQSISCVTTTCTATLDSACQAAIVAANQCINKHCLAQCR